MNERIQQLAEQAFFDESTNQPSDKMYTFTEHKMQQFAELIVKECGVALSPMLRDMVSRGQAFDLIKQHFGVEE
jgi:hypothetical protein